MRSNTLLKLLKVLLLAVLVLAAVACGGGGGGGNTAQTQSSTVQVVSCASATVAATIIASGTSSFVSSAVSISANQIVQWNNSSGFAHTVTSTTVPANGTFDAALGNGTSVCLKFTAVGVFNYHCAFHPVMTGSVTVN